MRSGVGWWSSGDVYAGDFCGVHPVPFRGLAKKEEAREQEVYISHIIEPRLDEYDILMTGQPIWRERLQGVGVINEAECLALGVTGPVLRSAGSSWDLRRDIPYLAYDRVDFDVIVGSYGDSFDRYAIRLNEIRESMRIVRQCVERCQKDTTPGEFRAKMPKTLKVA